MIRNRTVLDLSTVVPPVNRVCHGGVSQDGPANL